MTDDDLYEPIKEASLSSAHALVPLLMDLFDPKAVVDVGCGQGWWLSAFAERGCVVHGMDTDVVDQTRLAIPDDSFELVDLSTDWAQFGNWDLALSLEVADQIPDASAKQFVKQLCWLAPIILFSAAIPGQGGDGHVNEQWPGYWAEFFQRFGYRVSGALRWELWNDQRIEIAYRQNILLCVRDDLNLAARPRLEKLMEGPMATIWPVVHPAVWDARRDT